MCAMATVMNCKITAFFFHNLKIYVMPCSFSHESAASFVEIETLVADTRFIQCFLFCTSFLS